MKYVAKHGFPDALASASSSTSLRDLQVKLADHKPKLAWKSDCEGELSFAVLGKSLTVDIHITDAECSSRATCLFSSAVPGQFERISAKRSRRAREGARVRGRRGLATRSSIDPTPA